MIEHALKHKLPYKTNKTIKPKLKDSLILFVKLPEDLQNTILEYIA